MPTSKRVLFCRPLSAIVFLRICMLCTLTTLCFPISSLAQSSTQDAKFEANIRELSHQLSVLSKSAKEVVDEVTQYHADNRPPVNASASELLEWVRHSIRWVPYRGALKGANGTLLARQGNTLDQSLLLRSLLEAAGVESRVVQAKLSDADRELIYTELEQLDHFSTWMPGYRQFLNDNRGLISKIYASNSGESDSQANLLLTEIQQSTTLYTNQAAKLKQLLPSNFFALRDASALRNAVFNALAFDYWVQVRSPNAQWRNLSVLHGEDVPIQVVDRARPVDVETLADNLVHRVRLQVEVDTVKLDNGPPSTEVVFDHWFEPYRLQGNTMVLQFQPSGASDVVSLVRNADTELPFAEVMQSEYASHTAWVPTLALGRKTLERQKGFTADGEVFVYEEEMLGGLDDTTRENIGIAVDALQLDEKVETKSVQRIVAVRMVWTVSAPNAEAKKIARHIFRAQSDSVDGAAVDESALAQAMSRQTEILIQTGLIPWSHVEYHIANDFLQHYFGVRYLLGKLAKTGTDTDVLELVHKIISRPILPKETLILAAMRNEGLQHGFIDEPNIVSTMQNFRLAEDGSAVLYEDAIDLIHTNSSYNIENDREKRLESGIWDNVAELTLRGRENTRRNVSEALEAVDTSDIELIRSVDELSNLAVNDIQQSIMRSEVSDGYWLAISELDDSKALNWWRIDPASGVSTGQSMGIYDVGGAAISETTVLLVKFQISMFSYMLDMAKCSNENRGNAQKGLNCAICATIGHSLKMMKLLKVGGKAGSSVASGAGGITDKVCKAINKK